MSISPQTRSTSLPAAHPATDWIRSWRAAADVEQNLGVAIPLVGALIVGAIAAAFATFLGTSGGMDLRPTTLQIAAAVGAAALTLAIVPLAVHTTETRGHLLVATAALLSAGAAAIHFAVIDAHLEEWWGFGAFFIASASAQLLWSVLLLTWPSRPLFWAGVVGNAAIVALWVVTRVEGTILGPEPHEPEPVGLADGIATGFEITIVGLGLVLALIGVPGRNVLNRIAWLVGAITLSLTAVALISAMGAAADVIPPVE